MVTGLLFGQAKFIVLSVRTSLGQSQFIVQSDKDYLGHATCVWLKTSRTERLCFLSEAQAIVASRAPRRDSNSTHNQSVELGKAARQSFVLLLMQNQSGLNNRRRSLVQIDKRT